MDPTTIRRLIFLAILFAVAVPLFFDIDLTGSASEETSHFFAQIEKLDSTTTLLISFDFEASSLAEVKPLAKAILQHAFRRGIHVIGISLFAEGTALGEQILSTEAEKYQRHYGHDYVYLGFRPQYVAAILAMGESITTEYPTDYFGDATKSMPIFVSVDSYNEIDLAVSVADGSMPTYWAEYAVSRYDLRMAVALTASMATAYYPYLDSGQFNGLIAGLKGAAEYELLLGTKGGGRRGMFAQSTAQSVVILLIVLGNVVERLGRRKKWN